MKALTHSLERTVWCYIANRKNPILFWSLTDGAHNYFQKATGIKWTSRRIIRFSDGDFFYDAESFDQLYLIFLHGGKKTLVQFKDRLVYHLSILDQVTHSIERIDPEVLTTRRLNSIMQRYVRKAYYAHNFLTAILAAGDVLSGLIIKQLPKTRIDIQKKWLGFLTYPTRDTEHIKMGKAFYQLASIYQKPEFSLHIKRYMAKFAWIGARAFYWDRAWTDVDVRKRLDYFFQKVKIP